MLENTTTTWIGLLLACSAVALITLTSTVLIIFLINRTLMDLLQCALTSTPKPSQSLPVISGAAALVSAKKAEAALKPGRSCGHCGVRIKGDPIRGIALDDKSFLVYACPECKKETLLPQ